VWSWRENTDHSGIAQLQYSYGFFAESAKVVASHYPPGVHMRSHHLQETALRYFLEVVRRGSLTEASERLHVAPSAISRQIAGLETALGVQLFERHARGMVLNAAGELLAAHARRASLDAERTVEDILALEGLRSGKVHVAATDGFASEFLPALVVEFRRRFEGIFFELSVGTPAGVSDFVRNGDADIGLRFSRGPEKEIKIEYSQAAPMIAIMRPDHPLATSKAVTLKRMNAYPMALPKSDLTIRQLIDLACTRQQLRIEPVLTSNNIPILLKFVLEGGGISVSSEVSVHRLLTSGQLIAIPIRDRGLDMREIEVQTLAGRVLPHASQRFLDFLKQRLMQSTSETDDAN
jgi:DNA-binding transcriptional LysR family regulator